MGTPGKVSLAAKSNRKLASAVRRLGKHRKRHNDDDDDLDHMFDDDSHKPANPSAAIEMPTTSSAPAPTNMSQKEGTHDLAEGSSTTKSAVTKKKKTKHEKTKHNDDDDFAITKKKKKTKHEKTKHNDDDDFLDHLFD